MAEQVEEIIISVNVSTEETAKKLSEVVKGMAELRTEQNNLTKEIKEGNDADGQKAQRLAEVQAQISKLKNEQKQYTAILQNESKVANSYGDSLNEQRRKLADMQKAYDSLSASWRESSAGQAFKKQLDEQYDSVLNLEKATGRHQRNVGNYPNVMGGAVKSFGNLDGAIAQVSEAFNGLSTNGVKGLGGLASAIGNVGKIMLASPILALVGAIVVAFQKLSDAFKKNDEAGTNLDRAFSKLKPITQALGEYFDKLAVTVSELVLKFSEGAIAVGKFLNKIGLMKGNFEDAAKGAEELVIAEDNLDQAERDFAVNSAKRQRDIAELRALAVDSEKYSAEERIKLYEEAIELEQANLDEELRIAQERVRILKETAKQNVDTSDETANEIAQAEAALYKAEETYYTGTRKLQAQLVSAKKEIASEEAEIAKEQKKEAEKAQKEAEANAKKEAEALEAREKVKEEILRKFKETAISLIEDETTRAIALEQDRYEQELEALQAQYDALGTLTLEEEALKNENLELLEQEHLARMAEIEEEAYLIQEEKRLEREELELENKLLKAETEEEEFNLKIEAEQERLNRLLSLDEEAKAKQYETQEAYEKAVKESEDRLSKLQEQQMQARITKATTSMQAIGSVMGSMSQIISAFDNESEESAKAQKVLALGEIAVQTGVAIAQGISSAMSVPFPGNIVAIATTIATVVANIASAISTVKSAKFATGGVVGGNSYSGDNVNVRVNSGEMILNTKQQAELFAVANGNHAGGGIDYDLLGQKMAEAVTALAPPVLVYSEFKDFENNVQLYEDLTTFKA
jgi:hypothetical protein